MTEGYDFVGLDTDASDESGHGTLVANIIAGDRENNAGAAGVCGKCRIMPVRVLAGDGTAPAQGTTADVAAGVAWAADRGAQIINLSLSTTSNSLLLRDAVDHAAAKGALVVASAGNAYDTAHRYPAAFEPAFAVGRYAIPRNTESDRWVDVAASTGQLAIGKDGVKKQLGGTSSATAVVAGVAALALAMKPSATATEVRNLIQRDAEVRSGMEAGSPPVVNAAKVVYDLGGTDAVPPVLSSAGVDPNQVLGSEGVWFNPVVADDHAIERIDLLYQGKVISRAVQSNWQFLFIPSANFAGAMPVTLKAYDYAGHTAELRTTLQVDTRAPRITIVSPVKHQVYRGKVAVTVSSPDTDIAEIYGVHKGERMIRVADTNQWKGLVTPLGWTLELKATDKIGNSATVWQTVISDYEPPFGASVAPQTGTRVRGTFTADVSARDHHGVAKAELWANGKYIGADTRAPFELKVKTGTYNGNVKLVWKVSDVVGNVLTVPGGTVIADNKGPTVKITKAPKHKAKVKGTVVFVVKASDPSRIRKVELIVNGKVVAKDVESGYVLSVNTKNQKETMKVRVRAYDKLGNVSDTATRTWRR
ncbi:S8 family serine peptidase [Actinoplanes sp. CA-015351]|uniref:S8 family serine peptidase n=1 Tax=Actinoplanes sp. CA-015351 TaxID=3239897 RepID=UPI003D98B959